MKTYSIRTCKFNVAKIIGKNTSSAGKKIQIKKYSPNGLGKINCHETMIIGRFILCFLNLRNTVS